MHDEQTPLEQQLVELERSLRSGDHTTACLQLAEFALELDRYIRCEERVLAARLPGRQCIAKIEREHASLRRLVALIAEELDRSNDRRSAQVTSVLRSVLLLHVAKERSLLRAPDEAHDHTHA